MHRSPFEADELALDSADHDALDEVPLQERVDAQDRNGRDHNHAILNQFAVEGFGRQFTAKPRKTSLFITRQT